MKSFEINGIGIQSFDFDFKLYAMFLGGGKGTHKETEDGISHFLPWVFATSKYFTSHPFDVGTCIDL